MKKIFILLITAFMISSCSKNEISTTLPAATQTGAGTFGCLVNGVPYVDNSGFFNCYYQLVGGEYYFGIGSDKEQAGLSQIIIGSNKRTIITNTSIGLNENNDMEFYAEIKLQNVAGDFVTTNLEDGTIIFTRYDTNLNIVSAIFEFTIKIPTTGEIIKITQGRFDAKFTQ